MLVLLCYDVANPRRLRKVAKAMENVGQRVQRSVFECDVSEAMLTELLVEVRKIMNRKEDSLLIYPLCRRCRRSRKVEGSGTLLSEETAIII